MPIGKRHAVFIQNMVEFGETPEGQIKAYMLAYPKATHESARSRSHKLSHKDEIARLIQEGRAKRQEIIEQARKEELINKAKSSIISQTEVDAVLSDIITGKFVQKVKRVVFNPHRSVFEIVTVDQPPDASAVIAAIDKYNKRNGSYAGKKTDDVPPPAADNSQDRVIYPGDDY